ncbi:protein serine/threonine phosphatase 2C [Patellaria atrata CBS 101060]|uniref:Protein phosphatase n=1 Tax=Patellaria atrata CBS 101060 TaxID=1346257 RepID=A0A9P4VQC5_9PEZI|nr:protein serine/threonine phosphatase 2C [Patellaria atrata CBS 101060]
MLRGFVQSIALSSIILLAMNYTGLANLSGRLKTSLVGYVSYSSTWLCASNGPLAWPFDLRPSFCTTSDFSPAQRPMSRPFSTSPRSGSNKEFTYQISSSYSAKGRRFNASRNVFNYNPFVRITKTATELASGKKDKANRPESGQDAFFVASVGETSSMAFGVADGVGGWTESGIDPADFAHGLCDYMASAANAYPEGFKEGRLHPRDLLQIGYERVSKDDSVVGGGSTAVLAVADPAGTVEVANLGDSGFIHIGLNAVRYFTQPQTHAFNTPFQLSKIPAKMLAQMAVFGHSKPFAELPKDADVTNHTVRHGDILIFATDGVLDNLSPEDVLKVVTRYMTAVRAWVDTEDGPAVSDKLRQLTDLRDDGTSANKTLQAILATAIAGESKQASLNQKRDGPFAKEVQKHYPREGWRGGKPDDICVVVAVAVENEPPQAKL